MSGALGVSNPISGARRAPDAAESDRGYAAAEGPMRNLLADHEICVGAEELYRTMISELP